MKWKLSTLKVTDNQYSELS